MYNIYKTSSMKEYNKDDFHNPHFKNHGISNKHLLVCGPTGSGKSNFVTNLIVQMADTFRQIIICCKMTDEKIYKMLKDKLKDALDIMTLQQLPTLKNLEKKGQILLVFDDFLCDNQQKLKDYIMYARKYNIVCVFLAQSYFATDKFIRQNVSYLVLLSMTDARNTNLITTTLGLPIEKNVVKAIISNATKHKLNVCIIDIGNSDLNKKFRRNFTDYYVLEDDTGELIDNIQMFQGSGLLN